MMQVIRDTLRILSLRFTGDDVARLNWGYLVSGLVCTWLVGMGRYWDNPRAELLQHLGLGSVVYVFVLSFFLWCVAAPLRPARWRYFNVLTFVTLTSPPAALYAIPVERLTSLDNSISLNMWFLAVVAAWRVALLMMLYRRYAGLSVGRILLVTLLPLTAIVVCLMALNLEHVVFNIMGGLRPEERSANDGAYGVVFTLGVLSIYIFPICLVAYVLLAIGCWMKTGEVALAGPDVREDPASCQEE